ncbi:MAG: flavodoxin family protein [Frankiaceae bacterium]|nr:flavodoxin family protein [Frankiaceae bacterium]MBV9871617.1 flavodoxin family protein [Frankiaceae bacterium]
MPRLLVVHHTPSPVMQEMLEAVLAGTRDEAIEGVDVVVRPALTASVVDALEADGYLLGTPANIGYMSGALKHFFDTIYYPCLEVAKGRPFAAYLHGNLGTEGAARAIDTITTGLGWRQVAATVAVSGQLTRDDRLSLTELGGTVAATLMG